MTRERRGNRPAPGHAILTPPSWTASLEPGLLCPHGEPLEVDVGCGKGRFLIQRALQFPTHRFLGIERQWARIARIDRHLAREGITNVRLLFAEAGYAVARLLPAASVSAFYVFFPDPWPKRKHHPRRLFSRAFLDALHQALRPDGRVHAATDHADYAEQIRATFAADARFAPIEPFVPEPGRETDFELTFRAGGATIHRASYRRIEPGETTYAA